MRSTQEQEQAKKPFRRKAAFCITAAVIVILAAVLILALTNRQKSGDCGEAGSSVSWELRRDGTLVIRGEGAMKDYTVDAEAPWFDLWKTITSVEIEHGVTNVGAWAFCNCTKLSSVAIPDTVTCIGEHSFFFCINLSSITIPESVTTIGGYAFCLCEKLKDIRYTGTEEQWERIAVGVRCYPDDTAIRCSP